MALASLIVARRRTAGLADPPPAVAAPPGPAALLIVARRASDPPKDEPDGRPVRGAEENGPVNKVLLTGRLTRDPELRVLASGKSVTTFNVATNEYAGNGKERAEYHTIVTWDRLAEICGRYLGKGQHVAIEGRIQTRTWDDDQGRRHWKTEIVANQVEMLSGRRKKDYAAETAAQALEAQAAEFGLIDSSAAAAADEEEDAAAAREPDEITEEVLA